MALVGLGSDIVQINRLEGKNQDALAKRILNDQEWQQWQQSPQPTQFLAKRFAAKEAAAKALGTGIAQGITFRDFIIDHDSNGKPCLTLTGKAAEIAAQIGANHWLLSLSDERDYALATVICEGTTTES
ncbi:holo-ACP synthase [Celerinatantimonas yamalensis]|uniref:Holo-[acyl-carrier-protein] synthase n=1 Tax=Celerinatantimonas yamalensis TaxID=559956 RepID=A0ABW9G819_9GAMM